MKKRHTKEKIIRILKQAEPGMRGGAGAFVQPQPDVRREGVLPAAGAIFVVL